MHHTGMIADRLAKTTLWHNVDTHVARIARYRVVIAPPLTHVIDRSLPDLRPARIDRQFVYQREAIWPGVSDLALRHRAGHDAYKYCEC
jgi:hypothetical protein